MNRFRFEFKGISASHHSEVAKLFTIINTMGVNTEFELDEKGEGITALKVDLPFDDPLPGLQSFRTKIVDYSEVNSSPDLRLFPYVTVGAVVGIVATSDSPTSDFSRYYKYIINDETATNLTVFVGIANSALTESYAPFGIRENNKPADIKAMVVTSEQALQNMLNACACPPRNPSTGLSARDLIATSL